MKIISRLKSIINNPKKIILYFDAKGLFKYLSDNKYLKLIYYIKIGKKLDLKHPKTFNEKLQWLKLNDRKSIYTSYVDKFEVRNYIEKSIGKEYLIPLIEVYDSVNDIDFSKLPDKFVLKCTHDSGGVIICKDKKNFDIEYAKNELNRCLKKNFYYVGREWPYKNIKPRIICEKYMVDNVNNELIDYKLMCFNGEVKCSFVCLNREKGLNVDFYDRDWNIMDLERYYPKSGKILEKPINYELMIKFAEKLSKDIPFIRVDFYEINKKLYFGELTLYPGSGFEGFNPENYDYILGDWIKLP